MLKPHLADWAHKFKQDIIVLYLASQDSRTPFICKALTIFIAAYALSPIDLIPDYIPIIGWLDDLLIVPLGIALALKLMPPELLAEIRQDAAAHSGELPKSFAGAILVFLLWSLLVAMAFVIMVE
jgi:uncharacterized membrane protein YkvA (DUF1232 family)